MFAIMSLGMQRGKKTDNVIGSLISNSNQPAR